MDKAISFSAINKKPQERKEVVLDLEKTFKEFKKEVLQLIFPVMAVDVLEWPDTKTAAHLLLITIKMVEVVEVVIITEMKTSVATNVNTISITLLMAVILSNTRDLNSATTEIATTMINVSNAIHVTNATNVTNVNHVSNVTHANNATTVSASETTIKFSPLLTALVTPNSPSKSKPNTAVRKLNTQSELTTYLPALIQIN